jgi:DnaJ-class molecular chaperone
MDGVEAYQKRKAAGEQPHMDPFAAFFGGGHPGGRENKRPSIHIPLFISLKDLYQGKTVEASVFKQSRCKKCRGTGARTKKDLVTCGRCNGQGVVVNVQHIGGGMFQQFQQACPVCSGKGKIVKRVCNHCQGKKIVSGMEKVSVHVEKGMADGHVIKLSNICDEVAGSTDAPGDVNFVITPIKSSGSGYQLQRDGKHLRLTTSITLREALIGFRKEFEHFDGHIVDIDRSDKVTPHGHIERIRGEGMPVHEGHGEFGDLIVTFNVQFPSELTEEQRDAIRNLKNVV